MQKDFSTERLTLSVPEAAKRLGIGRSLAYDLANRGKLPGLIRLGHRYLVSKIALDQLLTGISSNDDVQPDNNPDVSR